MQMIIHSKYIETNTTFDYLKPMQGIRHSTYIFVRSFVDKIVLPLT